MSCLYLGTKDNPVEVIAHCLAYQIKIPHIEVVFLLIFAVNLNALFRLHLLSHFISFNGADTISMIVSITFRSWCCLQHRNFPLETYRVCKKVSEGMERSAPS